MSVPSEHPVGKPDDIPYHTAPGPVIDLGSGSDPDSRATHTADIRAVDGVDVKFSLLQDGWPFPDDGVHGLILNHVVEHFTREELTHVFREAGRVLEPGGWLSFAVPLGANYRTDRDHEPPAWTWDTPETLSRDHRRGWDPDVPFRLIDREVRMWAVQPFGFLTPAFRAGQRVLEDGLWSTELANAPLMAGELTATYRRVNQES
ncbi:methyltransferase domain-containing protein [Halolamina sp.]|uniref:methyltransferase domain-containing protein n=1 Tax=Halolamina sp. TaxID=1940283 RepID=UPI0035615658